MKRVGLVVLIFILVFSSLFIFRGYFQKPYNPLNQSVDSVVAEQLVDKWSRPHTLASAKNYLIYFAALWCPPCNPFTDQLDEFYQKYKKGNNFEVIFVSSDRDVREMFKYMQKMSWPAVEQDSLAHKMLTNAYGEDGIPNIVAIKADGEVLFASYKSGDYLGVETVLEQFAFYLEGTPESKSTHPIGVAGDVVSVVNSKKNDVVSYDGDKSPGDDSGVVSNVLVKPGEYILTAIFVSELKRGALINGIVYYEGDDIDGAVVQNVGKDSVILTREGVDIIVDITRE